MHGINGDHRAGQYKRAEQSLDGRDFIGFFVTVEMRQHQSRVGSKGAEYVRGAAVEKVVKASPQCLAIDRHMTLTFAVRRVVQHGGMAAERRFDRGWIKLTQDATNRRVSWGFSPLHAERIAQPSEVNIDEAVDSPIRVGTSDNCQDRKQHDVWQAIQLPFRPPRVLNFSQQIDKWTEWHHGNPVRGCEGCQQRSHMEPRRRNPLRRHPTAVCFGVWHFRLTRPSQPLLSPGRER